MAVLYSNLLTGVPSIDREHRLLIDLLSRLINDTPVSEPNSEAFSEILSQLGQQITQHFDNEEVFLSSCGMPAKGVAEHVKAHNEIIEQYTQLQFDLMSGKPLVRSDTLQMILEWILAHLLAYDVKIKPFASGYNARIAQEKNRH